MHDDLRRSHVVDVIPTDVPDAVDSAVVLGFVLLVRTNLEGTAAGMAGMSWLPRHSSHTTSALAAPDVWVSRIALV